MNHASPRQQRGAVLFVALIMLLVVTALAVSSLREVTMEARMTANSLEAKRLENAAEAGLRAGENTLSNAQSAPDASASCGTNATTPCVPYASASAAADYTAPKFGSSAPAATYTTSDATTYVNPTASGATASTTAIKWYAVPIGSTCVEDNCALTGKGAVFYYQVNSCASASSCATTDGSVQLITLRSVLAKVFN
ncbi:MAG: hypothetical protein GAK45_00403 [Pseudomonas citronellolis]|nr:MAG: hypothetical protein GAK45_00403 [Pseudomonas citronellolis]